jgi:hypothetical protein
MNSDESTVETVSVNRGEGFLHCSAGSLRRLSDKI